MIFQKVPAKKSAADHIGVALRSRESCGQDFYLESTFYCFVCILQVSSRGLQTN